MKIEIMEFYPIKETNNTKILIKGSITIRLPSLGIELRGIIVTKNKKGNWLFTSPGNWSICEKKGKKVRYTFFSFMEKSSKKLYEEELRKIVPKYIENKIKFCNPKKIIQVE